MVQFNAGSVSSFKTSIQNKLRNELLRYFDHFFMSQKEKNMQVVDAYIATKKVEINNGNTRVFYADVSYTNHQTSKMTVLPGTQIIVSIVYPFGGYTVKIAELQDKEGCFVEHNTNFNIFCFANNQLYIKGKDNTGTKGDFTLVLS